jgi:hypothetical protein
MDITMFKSVVLKTLGTNKAKHILEYKDQLDGWKLKMEEHSEKMKDWVNYGGTGQRPQEPSKPQNFIKEYDKYINMITCHVNDTIKLNEYEYEQIINDEFNWKGAFLANSTLYSNK